MLYWEEFKEDAPEYYTAHEVVNHVITVIDIKAIPIETHICTSTLQSLFLYDYDAFIFLFYKALCKILVLYHIYSINNTFYITTTDYFLTNSIVDNLKLFPLNNLYRLLSVSVSDIARSQNFKINKKVRLHAFLCVDNRFTALS